jgi:GNAT superfamily N-acetyltransferase
MLVVRAYERDRDEGWATAMLDRAFGGRGQVRRGERIDVLAPGLGHVAMEAGRPVGLLTFRGDGPRAVELTAIVAEPPGHGHGTALLESLVRSAAGGGATRIRVVTTNDNLGAIAFYQRRGFRLVAVRLGAVDAARRDLKPTIPALGASGIPIRDELEFELELGGGGAGLDSRGSADGAGIP